MESNKRKTPPQPIPKEECDILKITPLGAGQEVGRSCILVEYKEKKLLLDSGLHPAYSGLSALPYFDEIDPESIDLVLITHFHLDHAASLPYFMQKTTFKGRVFMTHPTRAIYKWLLSDYVKVSNLSTEDMLYTEQDLIDSFEKIEVIDYHQQVDVDGIKFTGYNAGHVLGAAMFLIEIAGVRILYTGDYSREEDRHLMAAERPKNIVPEVLICESTYGVQSHQPRLEREAMFTSLVHKTVGQGGRCLIPVFALGRAQELLLILDEYWQAHPQLHNIPIYYASSLAKRCMAVYQTYTNMMNEKIRKQIKENNPFHFKHISNLKGMRNFDDIGPCVMMASPGMLQSGLSRELLEMWCTDKKNGVIIPGYVVEGTMAKQILSQPDEITSSSGAKLPLRLSVDYISFSAHVDYQQNSQFIEEVGSPNLVLVHGDSNEMSRLRGALQDRYSEREQPLNIYSPRNCDCVELYFRGEKMAKIIGSLASKPPTSTTPLSGILIAKDYKYTLVAPEDLNEFTHGKLNLVKIRQKMFVGYKSTWELVKWYFGMMFGNVEISKDGDCVTILSSITVTKIDDRKLELEWEGNSINDMISDSVVAIIIQAETSPASVKATKSAHSHSHSDTCQKKQPVTPVKKVRGRKKASTKIVIEDSDGQEDDTNVYEDEGLFGFYATILLGNHFGRENIKYYNKTAEEIDDALMVYIPDAEGGENSEQQVTARSFIIEKLGQGVHCWGIFIGDEEEDQVEFGVVLLQKGCEIIVYCKNAELKERISMVAGRINRTLRPVEDTWIPTTK